LCVFFSLFFFLFVSTYKIFFFFGGGGVNVNYIHGHTPSSYDTFKFKNALVECKYSVADNTSKSFVSRQLFQSIRYFSEEGVDDEKL